MMTIRFWGVRGSIASGGAATAQVGGNTSCVELRCDDELIILDAGTGLRPLGAALMREDGPVRATLLISHFHWDHIQGFPFFAPAYVLGNRLAIYGAPAAGEVRDAFAAQMKSPHFPVGLDALRAELVFRTIGPGDPSRRGGTEHSGRFGTPIQIGSAEVRTAPARHPDGCVAFRVDHGGRSVVYATDTEHDDTGQLDEGLLDLARDADVLIYDAQYTAAEYSGSAGGGGKRGWGHSTAAEGARLARAAGVGQLLLYHHDPSHDDWAIARIEAETRALFPSTTAAREGLRIALDPAGRKAA